MIKINLQKLMNIIQDINRTFWIIFTILINLNKNYKFLEINIVLIIKQQNLMKLFQ